MSVDVDEAAPTPRGEVAPAAPAAPVRRRSKYFIGGVVFILVLVAGAWYFHAGGSEDTDDAQVDGHLVPIASRIDGTVQDVYVEDNQLVVAGQSLVYLDPRDAEIAIAQAKAQYDQATAQLSSAAPNLPIAQIGNRSDLASGKAEVSQAEAAAAGARQDFAAAIARLKESQALNDRAQASFQRYQRLLDKKEVARADYDQYKSAALGQLQTVAANEASVNASERTVDQRLAQVEQQKSNLQQAQLSAPFRVAIRDADIKSQRANAEAARAVYDKAKLNLKYGTILAPTAGVVTQRSVEPGARISSGQQILMIVQTNGLWVTANFKETQLAKMHPGQHVKVYVDAVRSDFTGTVESMPAVTGSRTSVLPPENATGNYVKVIQRMAVRIHLDQGQPYLEKLRPGMSAEPKVWVK